ncbi:cytochrome p450 domain-containing protein [Phthorimaea operculella]|nr:cytochrome p450 domain-containing protein [Phthorimaea operculella]
MKLYNELKTSFQCYPIIGHSYLFFGDGEGRMKGIQNVTQEILGENHNGTIAGWFPNKLYVLTADPETAEVIMKNCLEKDYTMKFMNTILGNGTIIAPVPIWRVRRKILSTNFSVKNLNGFVDVFSREAKIMAQKLQDIDYSKPISINKVISPCIMDIAYECVFGIKVGNQDRSEKPTIQAWDEFRDSVAKRASCPWLHSDFIYNLFPEAAQIRKHKKFLYGMAKEVINPKIQQKEEKINSNDTDVKTFLDGIIKASQRIGGYNASEIEEETLVLAFASSDSSTVGTSFAVLMLARQPEDQERIYQEVKEVFGDSERPVTPEDLLKLKFTEAFIKESMRLYPPVPVIVRDVEQDVVLPSGSTLPKDSGSLINIWAIHRNPRFWGPDAEVFRADRFMDLDLKHPAQYMPFSYGPRSCLGPQFAMTLMKTLISTLLRKYKILPVVSTADPIRVRFDITIKDVDHFKVRLEPRHVN